MSKKSRKRNKKILAAIGIGLGAAGMLSIIVVGVLTTDVVVDFFAGTKETSFL